MCSGYCRLLLAVIAWIAIVSTGWCVDFFSFKSYAPYSSPLSLINEDVVLGGASMSTCSRNAGVMRLWFEKATGKIQVMVVDDSKAPPRITIRDSDQTLAQLSDHQNIPDTVQWRWQSDGISIGDGTTKYLRVETGKYRDWYLAAEPKYEERIGGTPEQKDVFQRLKLVEDPKKAIRFGVYILSK